MARRSSRLAASANNRDIVDFFASSSASTPSSQQVPPGQPINPDKVSFLDLPGEIRNQIYCELLPDHEVQDVYPRNGLRSDGNKTSTTFMAVCQQVYMEAASILYAFVDLKKVEIDVWGDDHLSLLGRTFTLHDATAANFSILKRAKLLELNARSFVTESHESSCDVQDGMFLILSNLQSGHKVRSLKVHIEVGEDEDCYRDITPGSDSYTLSGRRLSFSEKLMREFRKIRPGDISRAHITAFLTDPLRLVRGINPGKGNFDLTFLGHSGRPWRDIPSQVRNVVQSSSPVAHYKIFTQYFQILRQLKKIVVDPFRVPLKPFVAWLPRQQAYIFGNGPEHQLREAIEALGEARIKGLVQNFMDAHERLLKVVQSLLTTKHDFVHAETHEQAELQEQWCRELVYLVDLLEHHLPPADADTSFFAYNVADEALKQWQEVGRKEEKEAKKKRKADKEAKGKAAKKAKIDDDDNDNE